MHKQRYIRRVIWLTIIIICITTLVGMSSKLFEDDQIEKIAKQLLNDINLAYVNEDEELLKEYYDTDILYGKWAYEYGLKKVDYLRQWKEKQGIEYTDIKSEYKFLKVSGTDQTYDLTVKSIDEYILSLIHI